MDEWWADLDNALLDCLAESGELSAAEGPSPASLAAMLVREGRLRIARIEGVDHARRRVDDEALRA
jgi:hypothetical protein